VPAPEVWRRFGQIARNGELRATWPRGAPDAGVLLFGVGRADLRGIPTLLAGSRRVSPAGVRRDVSETPDGRVAAGLLVFELR
jgi:hypothetical protein